MTKKNNELGKNNSKNENNSDTSKKILDILNKTQNASDYIGRPLIDYYDWHSNSRNLNQSNSILNKYKDYIDSQNHKIDDSKINIASEIVELQKQLNSAKNKFKEAQGDRDEIQKLYDKLNEKQKSSHIINRIHPGAGNKFLSCNAFKYKFDHGNEVDAVVISIDIRRSTDLMLKAKNPTQYSDFITALSQKLSQVIIDHLGIFDKFTGDGILAFFPKFYSGDHAILLALLAAEECHKVFKEFYTLNRNKFTVHIKNVGLGIGIDYGKVSIANTTSELTVVGRPVVYACRFSGAKAGDTLLNLEALEQIELLNHPMIKDIEESEIDIKNEGVATAFKIHFERNKFTFSEDYPWDKFEDDYTLSEDISKDDNNI